MDLLKSCNFIDQTWMLFASVDLKDVYFSVKFLQNIKILSVCFSWKIVWISGSATWVSRFHTYLYQTSKPVLSCLRCLGHTVLAFVDDTLLQGDTEQDCQSAMMATCQVFDSLGFTVHSVKSVLQPTQRIEFLEFWLDLVNMIVSLTTGKSRKSDQCVWNCWKWKCVLLDIRQILLVILLRLTWCLGLFLCFVKNGDCLNAALSETVVIVMLSWECLTLFGRTFYGGPIMWINFHPLFKGVSLMLL